MFQRYFIKSVHARYPLLKNIILKKITRFSLLVLSIALFAIMGCQEDDTPNVDSSPEFVNLESALSSLPGLTVNFQASISDPAGIKSIRLLYEPWFLDKTIRKDSLPETYDLNYAFQVPGDAVEGSSHTIEVIAENSGGVTTSQNITVTLDADIDAPQITINSPSNNATILIGDGDELNIDLNFTDNQDLASFSVSSDILNETVDLDGTSATYTQSLDITEPALYTFTFTLTDSAGNTTTSTRAVNVVEDLSFLNMYLADDTGITSFDNSLSGYPYATTSSTIAGEEGYVFTVNYYAPAANTGVYFVAQQSGFGPFAFGASEDNPGELVIGSDNSISPIVLGARGYYEIQMDLRDQSYEVTPIADPGSPNIAGFTGVYATGTGISIDGQAINQYNPATSAPLTIDPDNPFRYAAELLFNESNGSFIFVGNQANYGVFWRVNNGPIETTSAIVRQGGVECNFSQQYGGVYRLTVDIFLNTFVITQVE